MVCSSVPACLADREVLALGYQRNPYMLALVEVLAQEVETSAVAVHTAQTWSVVVVLAVVVAYQGRLDHRTLAGVRLAFPCGEADVVEEPKPIHPQALAASTWVDP